MKKLLTLLLSAILCLSFAACAAADAPAPTEEPDSAPSPPVEPAPVSQPVPAEEPEPEAVWTQIDGVTLSLLQTDYPTGLEKLTLILDNSSALQLEYGLHFSIQKYRDGAWRDEDFSDELFFHDALYSLPARSIGTMELSVGHLGLSLDEGLYRINGAPMWIGEDHRESPAWHVDFRVTSDAQPEPDYALYIPIRPVLTSEERLYVQLINNTGEGACMLDIPRLERRSDAGEWEAVSYKEGIGFCGTPDPLPAEGREWSEDISTLWGALEEGQYRLSYAVGSDFDTDQTVYGEFTVCGPELCGYPLADASK